MIDLIDPSFEELIKELKLNLDTFYPGIEDPGGLFVESWFELIPSSYTKVNDITANKNEYLKLGAHQVSMTIAYEFTAGLWYDFASKRRDFNTFIELMDKIVNTINKLSLVTYLYKFYPYDQKLFSYFDNATSGIGFLIECENGMHFVLANLRYD